MTCIFLILCTNDLIYDYDLMHTRWFGVNRRILMSITFIFGWVTYIMFDFISRYTVKALITVHGCYYICYHILLKNDASRCMLLTSWIETCT